MESRFDRKGDGAVPVVIIPAYKPDQALVTITDQLWTYGCRMIVVDDGSGQEYRRIFEKVEDICMVLRHSENRGKGAAIKTALTYINEILRADTPVDMRPKYEEIWDGGMAGIMDCDGQHAPEDMLKLLEAAGRHKKTLVLGVREVGTKMPFKSRLGNQITRTVFQLITGEKVSDTQTGLRAFDTELIPKLLSVEGERYEYEMNMLMACAKEKIPIEEVPVRTIYRDRDNSGSHFRKVRDSARIYKDILKFTLSSFSSFVLDYLLFSLLMIFMPHTAMYALFANMAARIVSAFYNYSMNCRFVFHTERRVKTTIHYFALAGFILAMNNLILEMFVQVFRVSVYPAKLLTECILFILSWAVQNGVIFRNSNCARMLYPGASHDGSSSVSQKCLPRNFYIGRRDQL